MQHIFCQAYKKNIKHAGKRLKKISPPAKRHTLCAWRFYHQRCPRAFCFAFAFMRAKSFLLLWMSVCVPANIPKRTKCKKGIYKKKSEYWITWWVWYVCARQNVSVIKKLFKNAHLFFYISASASHIVIFVNYLLLLYCTIYYSYTHTVIRK